jgi:hypothetical protein
VFLDHRTTPGRGDEADISQHSVTTSPHMIADSSNGPTLLPLRRGQRQ